MQTQQQQGITISPRALEFEPGVTERVEDCLNDYALHVVTMLAGRGIGDTVLRQAVLRQALRIEEQAMAAGSRSVI